MTSLFSKIGRLSQCVFLGLIIDLVMPGPGNAATAFATVQVTVMTPVAVAEASGMSFGTVMQNGTTGLVALTPDGAVTVKGVLMVDLDQVTSASFKLFGADSQAYTISFPEAVTFANGADSLMIGTFTHNAGETPTLGLDGYGNINIGATLVLKEQQGAGTYAGTLAVTISND